MSASGCAAHAGPGWWLKSSTDLAAWIGSSEFRAILPDSCVFAALICSVWLFPSGKIMGELGFAQVTYILLEELSSTPRKFVLWTPIVDELIRPSCPAAKDQPLRSGLRRGTRHCAAKSNPTLATGRHQHSRRPKQQPAKFTAATRPQSTRTTRSGAPPHGPVSTNLPIQSPLIPHAEQPEMLVRRDGHCTWLYVTDQPLMLPRAQLKRQ